MKIRIAFAGLLLVVAAACGTSPTAPAATDSASITDIQPRMEEKPAIQAAEGGGAMGTGN